MVGDVAVDVAVDAGADRTDVLTCRVSPTRFAEAGRRWSVASVRRVGARGQSERTARVGACGHAGRRFFAGFATVDSSGCPLHDGMFKNTFGEL